MFVNPALFTCPWILWVTFVVFDAFKNARALLIEVDALRYILIFLPPAELKLLKFAVTRTDPLFPRRFGGIGKVITGE
jgi:hypothetical protein